MGAALESGSADCLSKVMSSMPGFRFHPTDEELVMYYLKRKICGKRLKLDVIYETDVYKCDPEELPGLSVLKTGDRQWFFFCRRDRKYPNGARSNRGTRRGYWKATGKDRNVTCNNRAVGVKKTLVFYRGRAPSGERTDWVMHEYTMDEGELQRCQGVEDYYALYKVFKKSGPGPKNGEQYGAPFKEEEWADDNIVDFSISSADREVDIPNTATVSYNQLQPLLDDEIGDVINGMLDYELFLDQQHVIDHPGFPLVVSEETQSTVVDQFSDAVFPEPSGGIFHSVGQPRDLLPSFDFNQSVVTSHLHVSEAPEVTSTPNIQIEEFHFCEEDFLEINDLIGSEPTLSNVENPFESLQFEDGLSEYDLFQDAEMFLPELGSITQATVSHASMNSLHSNVQSQNYHWQPNPDDANLTGAEFWMHGERNTPIQAEVSFDSSSLPTTGIVCESASFLAEGNDNKSSMVEDVATSGFSSALWAFVESIPTTPASAADNALVNRALSRMSSFSRVKINHKHTNIAGEGKDTPTVKRASRNRVLFLSFPIIIALCAFLWISVGTLRVLGRCISP
ncbi:hypothetical protein TanjilG_03967 [Lupinus angustifolius]|uniref:NAC domain-containing protein n=1 Tax=Lupinus angustifolius TaxID=3871 RepID=A0A4P1RBM7_LUPAN|nr:PREDICTED: NAC domain-containing protein 17-like [Lupinus angustifolius]OIW06573.1 hypothetical protein TanjilG_03967 [Lupinus angustifolius]